MAIQFTENGMYGLSEGGIPSDNITNNELANSTIGVEQLAYGAAGSIIKVTSFMDSTNNIDPGSNQYGTIISTSFTRLRTDSHVWVYGFSSLAGQNAHRTGAYLQLNDTLKFEAVHEVTPDLSNGTDARRGYVLFNGIWKPDELRETTTVNVNFGYRVGNNGDNRIATYVNPTNLSARAHKHGTNIIFFEMYDEPKFFNEDSDLPGMGLGA